MASPLAGITLRTKLVLLLSAALVATFFVSTVLRIRWTRARLEAQLKQSANDIAVAIAADLAKHLTPDKDDDDISEELRAVKLRHPFAGSYIQLDWSPDDDVISTYTLPAEASETQVAHHTIKNKGQTVRRDEARRALFDHGQTMLRPTNRSTEPPWRTPDRPPSSRWPSAGAVAPKPSGHTFQQGIRGSNPVIEVSVPVDPPGIGHGQLMVSMSREPVEDVIRAERNASVAIATIGLLVFVLITTLIVDRVVGRPVTAMQLAMQSVQGGALDARVEVRSSDEVGLLARGFNAMLDRVERADTDIRAFNRRLGDEVQAATIDLERQNEALGQMNRLLLEARRELGDKERLAALGQLAAQLAHEIGTPLGSVSGHLQLALTGPNVPGPLKERLQVATRELERVSKIVRDYLDSTRTVRPERVPVELPRLIDEALDIALGADRRAHITVVQEISPAVGSLVSDPGLLRQILVNLLANAADAVSQTASAGRIEIQATVNDGQCALSIRDDGVGIAAEDVARIFEPFYTTKGRGKGTGLGLAICRELATALGGAISVESEPGRGSMFRLRIPLSPAPSPTTAPKGSNR